MHRYLLAALCILALAGCSPEFDWRSVSVAGGALSGVLPGRLQSETREVTFEGHALGLTMATAQAGSVLFALGHASLPPALGADPAARAELALAVTRSFYRNLGVPPHDPLPQPGQRFVIDGGTTSQPMRLEALVVVSPQYLLEAIVTAAPDNFARAPVGDFWLGLRLPSVAR